MRILWLVLAVVVFSQANALANRDSIGVKTIEGKLYILHKVAKGEGLYGIGRRYNVSVPNIENADPTVKDGLNPGDIVMVPSWQRGSFKTGNNAPSGNPTTSPKQELKKEQPKPEVKKPEPEVKKPVQEVKKNDVPEKSPTYYVVKPGESLFMIAKNNKVSISDIQKWNGLKDNNITTGQRLIIGYSTSANLEGVPEQQVADLGPEGSEKKPNLKQDHIDQKITKEYKEYEDAAKKLEAERKKGKTEMKEIKEGGVATLIDDGTVVSEKRLALHRTAPPGTIIQLTNPRNGRRVFVKVIGKLPDAVDEQNVLIKVTKNTAHELGAIDKFFRVEMKYGIEVPVTKRTP
jgi:LysM repeat protein